MAGGGRLLPRHNSWDTLVLLLAPWARQGCACAWQGLGAGLGLHRATANAAGPGSRDGPKPTNSDPAETSLPDGSQNDGSQMLTSGPQARNLGTNRMIP